MPKCQICNKHLDSKAIDTLRILDKKERKRLEKIRRKRGTCSDCAISMIMITL